MVSGIKTFYIVFAILTILGGIMGYVKAKSFISLLAGTLSGALLITASLLLPGRPICAYIIALSVSVLHAGKFVPDYIHKKAFVPAGLMSILSVASIVFTLLALHK